MINTITKCRKSAQDGFTLVEVLVAMVVMAIAALGVLSSHATALRVAKLTEAHQAASSLAASKVEQLSAVDPELLNSSDNEVDIHVTWPSLNVDFRRDTTVAINADSSRTIYVRVHSETLSIPTEVKFQTRIALWE